MPWIKAILRRLLWTTSLLLLLLLVALGFLLYAPHGPLWSAQLLDKLTPGTLAIEKIEGRLSGPLTIRKLSYIEGALKVRINQLQFDWRPLSLLSGKIQVRLLEAEGFALDLPPASEDQPTPFSGVELPLKIVLEQARVKSIQVSPADAAVVPIDEIELRAHAAGEQLLIEAASISAYNARVQLNGTLKLTQALPINLQLEWDYRLPEGGSQLGRGELSGDLTRLQLSQRLDGPLQGAIEAALFDLEKEPHWDASLHIGRLQTATFLPELPMSISGELKSMGRIDDLRLHGNLQIEAPQLGLLKTDLLVVSDGSRIRAEKLHLATAQDGSLDATGYWSFAHKPGQRFKADIDWRGLRWPVVGTEMRVGSEQGSLRLAGDTDNYRYDLAMDLAAPQAPMMNLQSKGAGSMQGLNLDSLSMQLLGGVVDGSGTLSWKPYISGSLALEGKELDPGQAYAEWPGKVGFKLSSQGKIEQNRMTAKASLERLQGELRGYPLLGSGALALTEDGLNISNLKIASGEANLTAAGSIGKRMALTWNIEAKDLAKVVPGAKGGLSILGALSGTAEKPRLLAELSAANLRYQTGRIERLEGVIDVDLDQNYQQKLDIHAQGLAWDELRWQELKLIGDGTRADHQLNLKLAGNGAPEAEIGITAGLSPEMIWQGSVHTLVLDHPTGGTWRLRETQSFIVGPKRTHVEPGCLHSDRGSLCYQLAEEESGHWQGKITGEHLPLSLLSLWLPEQFDLTGSADVEADIQRDGANIFSGDLELALTEASIEHPDLQRAFDLSKAAISARLHTRGLDARLRLPVAGVGAIVGDLQLPGLNPQLLRLESQPLAGQLQATLNNLSFLSGLFPAVQAVAGSADVDFAFSGTLAAPKIAGRGELIDAGFEVPALGIKISEMGLEARSFADKQLDYTGQMVSGDGRLTLRGTTKIDPSRGWPTELEVKGEQFLAADLPEAWLLISPDLRLKRQIDRTHLNGEILIPKARLHPKSVPDSATTNSRDLAFAGDSQQINERTDTSGLYAQVRLMLGDQVEFDGFGLRGRFNGNLMIIDEPGRPVLGNGLLRIKDGLYQAYGQDLKIEKGQALFTATPIDNPGLDIEAVRKVEEINAGLRVTGTLKKPRLDLFSKPALPESEILSYLLLGRPSDANSTMTKESTAALLAASGVQQFTKEIGRQVGLEELRLETGGTLSSAAIVAGTYLSPRLYVQYINEIDTHENRVRLRYDLNEKVQIQTETGRNQGVDIFYTIER